MMNEHRAFSPSNIYLEPQYSSGLLIDWGSDQALQAPSVFSGFSQTSLIHRHTVSLPPLIKKSKNVYLQRFQYFLKHFAAYRKRTVIVFFIIVGLSLALPWLIVGLIRFRQVGYGQTCVKAQCSTSAGLTCLSNVCQCNTNQYYDGKKCQTQMNVNKTGCTRHEQCDSKLHLLCVQGTCQCQQNQYYTITGCKPYLIYNVTCTPGVNPLCSPSMSLICSPILLVCVCSTNTFWNGANCQSVSSYQGYCSQDSTCDVTKGLFCRISTAIVACDCPETSKLFTCDCYSGQIWNGTQCVNQLAYNSTCVSSSQCSQTLSLTCIAGLCGCQLPLYYWSSLTYSRCTPCEIVTGYVLIQFQSQYVCTRMMTPNTLSTFSTSQQLCLTNGWLLISPIVQADIAKISATYPPYRMWMNIQYNASGSGYLNNLFPTLPNWNSAIVNSTPQYSSSVYALQLIPTYDTNFLFESNMNVDYAYTLCAIY
ncbi:unnamed protein product [Didymodactylos carnosus]|uniref:EGF-like domain-containing protein n=1 Tax=Didymodactylos carnosus TaxID=1234261 RepID=A0A814X2Q5_9BILA|nr:unnamed protein product [Didymodactylos carnosus]CAF1210105.1 unnamed protein product [Didymodactylos carnosus]CAF3974193.1 unnamed protein product [Didymodactylos carnosus]CAF4012042.1 unnamed protein product [Didymodactylos carnosus]